VARRRGSDPRPRTAVAAALCALAAAGCGLGAGDDAGEVELTVTRDYGMETLVEESEPVSESDTVMRVLDRSADIETRFGGGFVQSIDGLAGGSEGGRRSDWFFFVNGIESPIGAAEFGLDDGDRIWWDHRDWTAAMRAPAVVGSFPEPFVHGFQGERYPISLECHTADATCRSVAGKLEAEGATVLQNAVVIGSAEVRKKGTELTLRLIVGPWNKVRSMPDVGVLSEGPASSGVFATFTGPGPTVLTLLNQRGEPAGTIGRGGGLVAAVRPDDDPPTWVVTGTDAAGVESAVAALGDPLENRYAVVTEPGTEPIGVPVP
jgi:Domain of unknown function (DUF4430)